MMRTLHAYEVETPHAPYWEIYDDNVTAPPDILGEDEFGEWLNGYGKRYDVRINTIASYYELLAQEYADVD